MSFYSGYVQRGVENWLEELVSRLKVNNRIIVYQAGDKFSFSDTRVIKTEYDDKKNQGYDLLRRFFLDYRSRKIFAFSLKAFFDMPGDIDIVIPLNGGWQSILCKLYCLFKKKKYVVIGHSGIGWDDLFNLMTGPDVFVALTVMEKQWLESRKSKVRIELIPDAVDVNKFTPVGKKVKINLPGPVILAVSALGLGKRIDLAIRAVAKLGSASLVVLGKGDGPTTDQIRELGRKLLGDRFLLTSVPYQEIDRWYRSCDVFTLPTWGRGAFGMVILEAMACNKIVVVNDDPARRVIAGKAGIYCNPENTGEYADALARALTANPQDLPRKQALEFSWDRIAKLYHNLFSSL
jgi:glycosyltransferase involved in cell wall biosynthesis